MNDKKDQAPIGLNELIYQVKRELLCKSAEEDPVPLFAVDEVQLEIAVTVSKEAQGGINIQVLNVGGGTGSERAQTVRVTLKPLRTREEIIAYMTTSDPALMEKINQEIPNLLKGLIEPGPQEPGQQGSGKQVPDGKETPPKLSWP